MGGREGGSGNHSIKAGLQFKTGWHGCEHPEPEFWGTMGQGKVQVNPDSEPRENKTKYGKERTFLGHSRPWAAACRCLDDCAGRR